MTWLNVAALVIGYSVLVILPLVGALTLWEWATSRRPPLLCRLGLHCYPAPSPFSAPPHLRCDRCGKEMT